MAREPSHLKREIQLLDLLQEISLAVARATTTNEAFTAVLGRICRFMEWPLGHVYIWSEAVNALVSSRIWYMADASTIAPFRDLSEATQFRKGEGTLGRVWESGEALSILDVRTENIFVRQMPVEEGGIRAYFAFPIIVEEAVAAVLEFFSPESVAPDKDMTSIINHVSTLLGLAIQRQQTIIRLQQSEAQLAEAQRTAHVGHWEWDILTNEVTWSPELYRIHGLSPDNFRTNYENILERVHPDDLVFMQQKVTDACTNGRAFDYFHRIVRPDGSERVLHARGRPIYDEAGHIIKLYGTTQDMTEQKEAELKLAQTVRQLSALMEIGQAISATLDLELIYDRVLALVRPLVGAEALLLFIQKDDVLEIAALDQDNAPNVRMRGMRVAINEGVAGEVWQSQQSLFLQGENCLQWLSPQLTEKTGYRPQAMLAVPLRWQTKSVGVLEATHHDPNAFDEEALRLLETAAAWTALAIGNARQYEQAQRRLSETNALLAISNALTETWNLDAVLQLIVDHAQDVILKADWAAIHLLQPKSKQLALVASAGLEINPDAYLINPGEGVVGWVMTEGKVLNVADMQTDPRRLPVDLSIQARALLAAPVESQQQRVGTISVQCATPSIFTPDDERLVKILGVQAGMAIENVRLYAAQQRARERAEKQRERMRYMARRVMQAQEKERARIARELHDESGQSLTSLKISLNLIRSLLPDEMADIKESLETVLALTDRTMSNLRLLSHNLRPPGLDAYGLDAALSGLCQDFDAHTDLKVIYEGVELPGLASLSALSLYRFAQEALTNVAKYAQASEAQVTLAQKSDMITLAVVDNGRGFSPPDLDDIILSDGTGLLGMVERLEMVDGHLQIESSVGKGSRLTAVVPYKTEKT